MPSRAFPDPHEAGPQGLVAVGDDLRPETLLEAYRLGIFPWPVDGLPLPWFCPDERAVIFFDALHVPRSLAKLARRQPFELTLDRAFEAVIRGCAETPRAGQSGTWITPAMIAAYTNLHRMGHAHSVEAWRGGELVGGIYGVELDGVFSAESMFHRASNASKLALLELIRRLEAAGAGWLDVQQMSPHVEALGARTLPRAEYLRLLYRTQREGRRLLEPPYGRSPAAGASP